MNIITKTGNDKGKGTCILSLILLNLGLYAKLFLNFVCIVSLPDLVFINACAWIKSFISMTVCPKKEFLCIP